MRAIRILFLSFAIAASTFATSYTFRNLSGPAGAVDISFSGINDSGTLVGNYTDSSGSHVAFIDNGGAFTTVSYLSSSTTLTGLNSNGEVIGSLAGYPAFSAINQVVTTYGGFSAFGLPATPYLSGVNDSGVIVGNVYANPVFAGLIIQPDGSSTIVSSLNLPGFRPDEGWGLNDIDNAGDIVGRYTYVFGTPTQPSGENGFLLPGSGGPAILLNGAAYGINNFGEIVGNSDTYAPGNVTGYIYQNGVYQSLIAPGPDGAMGTYLIGVNDSGDILGYTFPSDPNTPDYPQYFLATPVSNTPEPQSLTLVLLGVLALPSLRLLKCYRQEMKTR